MKREELAQRHTRAAEEFNRHEHRDDGSLVAGSLVGGLNLLRDLLYLRVHPDVERMLGRDSMLTPLSEVKTEKQTKAEIDLYQIAESAATVRQHGYVGTRDDWYLRWLTRLMLGQAPADPNTVKRLDRYVSEPPDARRLTFTDVLASVLSESRQAPLVLFRLVPLSIQIATALAFGDHGRAREIRKSQIVHLPAISYCQQCHGKVLENGEHCRGCGNPLWKYEWLVATD